MLKNLRKALVSTLCVGMLASATPLNVFAEDYSSNSDINIETQAATISVTAPSSLAWIFNEDGTNTYGDNFSITNTSKVDLTLKSATFTNQNGWSLTSDTEFETNSKKVNLTLNGVSQTDNVYSFNENIAKDGGTYGITFVAQRANFTKDNASEKAFSVVFSYEYTDKVEESTMDIDTWRATWSNKSLGETITSEQLAEIKSGNLTTIGLGDYWTIDSKTYRVADYAYYSTNDLVLVPDESLGAMRMNSSDTNATGYFGSAGYTTLHSTIKDALPEVIKSNLYTHDITVSTATDTSNYTNTWETKSSDGIELMSVAQVFGSDDNITSAYKSSGWKNYGYVSPSTDTQFAMFKYNLDGSDAVSLLGQKTSSLTNITKSYYWWLSSSAYSSYFANVLYSDYVSNNGDSLSHNSAGSTRGVRPAIIIQGA